MLKFLMTLLKKEEVPKKKSIKKFVSLDDFFMISVLGKGSYAKVILVKKRETDEIFAMKVLKKSHIEKRKYEKYVLTERNVLVDIEHPFLIKMKYSFQNERKLFFVLEYCPGGELFNLLQKKQKFNEDQLILMLYKYYYFQKE